MDEDPSGIGGGGRHHLEAGNREPPPSFFQNTAAEKKSFIPGTSPSCSGHCVFLLYKHPAYIRTSKQSLFIIKTRCR